MRTLTLRDGTEMPSWPDGPHLPGVEFFQQRVLSLRPERDAGAVFAIRIDPHGKVELLVDEDFHHAAIYEYAQLQWLVATLHDGPFRWPDPDVRVGA